MRPEVEELEGRLVPSTLGPKGRNLLASEIRLAEQTIKKEVQIVMKDGSAAQQAALNILQTAAEELAAVLNPPAPVQ